MDNVRELNWREECTMRAFQKMAVLRHCDLPPLVGLKTMAALVELGLVELVDRKAGLYAKTRSWQRTNKLN